MYTLNARRAIRLEHSIGEFTDDTLYRGHAVSSVRFRTNVRPRIHSLALCIESDGPLTCRSRSTATSSLAARVSLNHLVPQMLYRFRPNAHIHLTHATSHPRLSRAIPRSAILKMGHPTRGRRFDVFGISLLCFSALLFSSLSVHILHDRNASPAI